MAKLNDLEDVTISNPKAGDVVKYTATGWTNAADATGSAPGGNPCGNLDDYTHKDKPATITEPWTWSIEDGESVRVEHQDGVNQLDEYTDIYPGRIVVGNKNGRGELKTFDGGNTRLSAFSDQLSFYDVNNPDGVTLSELVACCDGGSGGSSTGGAGTNAAQMINFPNGGVFSYEAGRQIKTAWDPSISSNPFDSVWNDTALFDVFDKEANAQVVTMPPGTNSAVLFFTYSLTLSPTSLVTTEIKDAHANAAYNMEISDNKGSVTLAPGPLAVSVRARTEIIPWEQASQIGDGSLDDIRRRSPGQSTSGSKAIRIYFTESTEANPTRITLKPSCNILRVRRCLLTVGSGRVVCIPFKDDGNNFTPTQFALSGEDYDEFMQDDGGLDIAFEQAIESQELKRELNYYVTSISETLNYDTGLDPAGVPVLQGALTDLFDLKRDTTTDFEYYYNRLNTIRQLVAPYVAFQFGFETVNTVRSF